MAAAAAASAGAGVGAGAAAPAGRQRRNGGSRRSRRRRPAQRLRGRLRQLRRADGLNDADGGSRGRAAEWRVARPLPRPSPHRTSRGSGPKAELAALKAQVAEAAARRKAELEGGEKAHAAAMAAHGTSALHARLLWTEAHQLEEAPAEAGAALAKERRESHHALKEKESIIAELRCSCSSRRRSTSSSSRARPPRAAPQHARVPREQERRRAAARCARGAAGNVRGDAPALMREQKEKAHPEASPPSCTNTRRGCRAWSVRSTRRARRRRAAKTRPRRPPSRGADREVLVEVRQMASQLAAARAATEAANNQPIIVQESAERLGARDGVGQRVGQGAGVGAGCRVRAPAAGRGREVADGRRGERRHAAARGPAEAELSSRSRPRRRRRPTARPSRRRMPSRRRWRAPALRAAREVEEAPRHAV